ncbi:MAG TPA: hypothetical protein VGH36_07510, partial [Acetobacteraceae bacterium]
MRPVLHIALRIALGIASWGFRLLAGLVVLAVAVLFILPNTGPGAQLIARVLTQATGGQVVIQGWSGRFPDAPRIAHLEIHDQAGAWLAIDDLALDWSPLRLLHREARIDRLSASRVAVARLPQSS